LTGGSGILFQYKRPDVWVSSNNGHTCMGWGSLTCELRSMRIWGMKSGTSYGYACTYAHRPRTPAWRLMIFSMATASERIVFLILVELRRSKWSWKNVCPINMSLTWLIKFEIYTHVRKWAVNWVWEIQMSIQYEPNKFMLHTELTFDLGVTFKFCVSSNLPIAQVHLALNN